MKNQKQYLEYKRERLQELSKCLPLKSDSVNFFDISDDMTISLFTKHNKNNSVHGVASALRKEYKNYTKLTGKFIAFKTDTGGMFHHVIRDLPESHKKTIYDKI